MNGPTLDSLRRPAAHAAAVLLTCLAAAAGCTTPRGGLPAEPSGGADARTKAALRPTLGHPTLLDDNGLVVIPFALESPDAGREKFSFSPNISSGEYFSVSSASSGLGSFSGKSASDAFSLDGVQWHNIFFVDDTTGDTRLLLDRRAVICDFIRPAYRRPPTDPDAAAGQPTKADFFLVGIAESDTNGDRLINGDDAVVLHHCDLAGRKLTPLTPAGAQFVGVAAARPDRLYLRVRRDADGNRVFDGRDPVTLLWVDPRKPGRGTEVVSEEGVRRAADLVTR